MKRAHIIILDNDVEISYLCNELAAEINIGIVCKADIASFLLDIQENNYQAAVLCCDNIEPEILKWIKVIHKVRPKVPLILLSNQIDENFAGSLYEEGVFYMGSSPIHKELLSEILEASLTVSKAK